MKQFWDGSSFNSFSIIIFIARGSELTIMLVAIFFHIRLSIIISLSINSYFILSKPLNYVKALLITLIFQHLS